MLTTSSILIRRLFKITIPLAVLQKKYGKFDVNNVIPESLKELYALPINEIGTTALDTWKEEHNYIIEQIGKEKTWDLQKKKLLWNLIQRIRWIELYNNIEPTCDIDIWEPIVRGSAPFDGIDKKHYYRLLMHYYLSSALAYSTAFSIAISAYGLNEQGLSASMNVYKHNYGQYIKDYIKIGEYIFRIIGGNKNPADDPEEYKQIRPLLDGLLEEMISLNKVIENLIIEQKSNPYLLDLIVDVAAKRNAVFELIK